MGKEKNKKRRKRKKKKKRLVGREATIDSGEYEETSEEISEFDEPDTEPEPEDEPEDDTESEPGRTPEDSEAENEETSAFISFSKEMHPPIEKVNQKQNIWYRKKSDLEAKNKSEDEAEPEEREIRDAKHHYQYYDPNKSNRKSFKVNANVLLPELQSKQRKENKKKLLAKHEKERKKLISKLANLDAIIFGTPTKEKKEKRQKEKEKENE